MEKFREIKTKDGVKLLPLNTYSELDCKGIECTECILRAMRGKYVRDCCNELTQTEINDYIKEVEIMECPLLKCPLKPNETCPLKKKTIPLKLMDGRVINIDETDIDEVNKYVGTIGQLLDGDSDILEWKQKGLFLGWKVNREWLIGFDSMDRIIAVPLKLGTGKKYGGTNETNA